MSDIGANFPSGNPLDPSGNLAPQWRMFFLTLFTRSGGTAGTDLSALQSAVEAANANIADLQAEDMQGVPALDTTVVFGMIHAVEAIAAQAMAAAARQPDERGEAGDSASITHLSQRVAELEGQLEHYRADDALRQRITDMEAKLDELASPQPALLQDLEILVSAGDTCVTDASQMTGFGTMATQNASTVAITGGAIDGASIGQTTGAQAITCTGLLTGQRFGSSGAMVLRSANGTEAAPTALTGVTTLFTIIGRGYDGGSYRVGGNISIVTDGAVSSTSCPAHMTFGTTPSGSVTSSERMRITNAGALLIATATDDGSGNKLQVNGGLSVSPATTTTAPAAGAAGALPATPAGYASITIGGTARKIAYY
jgi:hypothetical protein